KSSEDSTPSKNSWPSADAQSSLSSTLMPWAPKIQPFCGRWLAAVLVPPSDQSKGLSTPFMRQLAPALPATPVSSTSWVGLWPLPLVAPSWNTNLSLSLASHSASIAMYLEVDDAPGREIMS